MPRRRTSHATLRPPHSHRWYAQKEKDEEEREERRAAEAAAGVERVNVFGMKVPVVPVGVVGRALPCDPAGTLTVHGWHRQACKKAPRSV